KEQGPLPITRACDYVRQACLGLQHAHEQGLVHRDIKPANLLLAMNGAVVKILDMGLARLERIRVTGPDSSDLTEFGMVLGTPGYLAPEQACDPRAADVRSDLYSLGCTLYYLLTGQPPFPGGSFTDKIVKHAEHDPMPVEQLRQEIPAGLQAIIRRLMAK